MLFAVSSPFLKWCHRHQLTNLPNLHKSSQSRFFDVENHSQSQVMLNMERVCFCQEQNWWLSKSQVIWTINELYIILKDHLYLYLF